MHVGGKCSDRFHYNDPVQSLQGTVLLQYLAPSLLNQTLEIILQSPIKYCLLHLNRLPNVCTGKKRRNVCGKLCHGSLILK